MDPDANLAELRALVTVVTASLEAARAVDPFDVARMTELFDALDNWITHGGFLPSDWQN